MGMRGAARLVRGGLGIVVAVAAVVVCAPAYAQFGSSLFGSAPAQQFAPSTGPSAIPSGSGGSSVVAPAGRPPQMAPSAQAVQQQIPSSQVSLALSARFGRDLGPITSGLMWRVYPAKPDASRAYKPIKEDRSPNPVFILPAGNYVVHVSFGLASAAKAVSLRTETVREVFDLAAGGIRLEGRVADVRIAAGQISFDIYRGSQFDTGDRQPLITGMGSGEVAVLPEGTYYIVSNYGDSNAVVRSDIRVQAGKLTDVSVSHRAAAITLKLAAKDGGDALANTEWTVLTPGGDVVKESIGAFPKVILAEGEYRAIARNEGRTYERNFKVTTGVDGEIEVLAR